MTTMMAVLCYDAIYICWPPIVQFSCILACIVLRTTWLRAWAVAWAGRHAVAPRACLVIHASLLIAVLLPILLAGGALSSTTS
jgi:hypothetical protein